LGKRKGDNRWLWTVVCTFGLLSFAPFIWAAIQTRSERFRTAAIVSGVASALVWISLIAGGVFAAADEGQEMRDAGVPDAVVETAGPQGDAWAYWVVAVVWAVTSAYALYLNPEYVQWRARRIGNQAASEFGQPPLGLLNPPPPPAGAPSMHITTNIYGGTNSVNTQGAMVNAGGDVTDVNSGAVEQSTSSEGLEPAVILALIEQYRIALVELDHDARHVAEHRLDQLALEMATAEPDEPAVKGHLESVRAIAHQAVMAGAGRAAGAGGAALLSALLSNWPL
jgi:hypothetical protein